MGKGGGRKRKWGGDPQGGGGGKGGGKGKASKHRTSSGPLPAQAVMVSSHVPSLCTKATQEATRLLLDALEVARPCAHEGAKEDRGDSAERAGRSVTDALQAELEELQNDSDSATQGSRSPGIVFHSEVTRGLAILACNPRMDVSNFPPPSKLVAEVFRACRKDAEDFREVRFVVRMIPLDVVCSPHPKNFRAAAEASLPGAFASAKEGATWYLAFHNRAMSTIKRDDALEILKGILNPLNFELSVSDAEYTVVIEVNPTLCGFSVLRGYGSVLHECNLQKSSAASHSEEDVPEEGSGEEQGSPRESK